MNFFIPFNLESNIVTLVMLYDVFKARPKTTKFGIVTHMGRGVFFEGEPSHCICTNASRGLSAIAEFLVSETKFTVGKSKDGLYCGEEERLLGKNSTLGGGVNSIKRW